MATSDFLVFDETGTNIQSQSAYTADTARTQGVASGPGASAKFNKAMRQASMGAAALAKIAADLGLTMPDDGDLAGFTARIVSAINTTARMPPQIAQTTVTTAQTSVDFQWTPGLYEQIIMRWTGLKAPLVSGNSAVINPSFKTNGTFIRTTAAGFADPTNGMSGYLEITHGASTFPSLYGAFGYEPLPVGMTRTASLLYDPNANVWSGTGLVAGVGMQCNYSGTVSNIQPGAVFTVYAR